MTSGLCYPYSLFLMPLEHRPIFQANRGRIRNASIMAGVFRAAVFLAILAVSIPGIRYFLHKYQDADLTLHFYDHFGVEPSSVLRGKVVWITGASSGIGEQLAYEFIKHGSKVVLSARRVKELERVRDKCISVGKNLEKGFDVKDVLVLHLDMKRFDSHRDATIQVLQHFGQIDILLNNAGVFQVSWAKDLSLDIDQHVMDVNFMGAVSLTKAVLPHMLQRNQGLIGNVNAGFGKFGFPLHTSYAASKFALRGYFDALRLELLSRSIDVSNFLVGPVLTPLIAEAVTDKNKPFKEVYTMPGPSGIVPMKPDRCAQLIVTSLVNRLDETWVSVQPALELYYFKQYLPSLFNWLSKTVVHQHSLGFAKLSGLPPP